MVYRFGAAKTIRKTVAAIYDRRFLILPSAFLLIVASLDEAKIIFVPRRRNFLPRRIRPRLIRARRDPLLTQLAHVPILFVRHVPEFNRVLRFEILSGERVRMKKPVAHD